MATQPTITLSTSETSFQIGNGSNFSYTLFGADAMFEDWADWALDSANASVTTTNMRNNAANYTGYVMKIFCDTQSVAEVDTGTVDADGNAIM